VSINQTKQKISLINISVVQISSRWILMTDGERRGSVCKHANKVKI